MGDGMEWEDRIPDKPPFGPLPWAEFLFLQISQVLHPVLVPILRRKGRCVAAGAITSTSWALSLPKVTSQTLLALPYRKIRVARLRGAGNLNF